MNVYLKDKQHIIKEKLIVWLTKNQGSFMDDQQTMINTDKFVGRTYNYYCLQQIKMIVLAVIYVEWEEGVRTFKAVTHVSVTLATT